MSLGWVCDSGCKARASVSSALGRDRGEDRAIRDGRFFQLVPLQRKQQRESATP